MQQPALILMVKNPIAGHTKTRLAAEVGDEKALRMYGMLIRHTRDQAVALDGVTRYLHYSDHVDDNDEWPNDSFIKLVQVGNDLGERMAAAVDHAFVRNQGKVIIIGSDCPGVTTELLRRALDELDTHELVIGPAVDGGYYLMGMRHPHPSLFQYMTWSTQYVLDETLARAQVLGLSVARLPELSDVDHLEDWQSYGWPMP
ncbi:TIGR04282 family arsenosugar biosynthesis glycosyltransferase [Lewinella sp. IMCC34183]|uniref:TIGR04282 family arsenosugar biosynthesis glycosyltransferase n=1 Tax=Lewinella sp. IMCC34183 TaxID=2248762 RepID=UPI000E265D17|nr:TIGR04282 family arsenosugar biosynthesis glycosyltransferase [Lewinella sp. IMCC34183]